ncbi:hypothetical protein AVEN_179406-1 [Araneus ventricosus]|uniref:Tesmin/TSO1-like CXC domain-containing protein n=1 Tax=Araneus ventricosus TaxID=182803 RepID=A0A4Y2BFG3_ARAVE|nr:hypothetical protein AVEN_179406-1 [Araneus ventricosus]
MLLPLPHRAVVACAGNRKRTKCCLMVTRDRRKPMRRISLLKKSDSELQNYFEFELAPFPLTLFDEGELRKTSKSVFYYLFFTATDVHFTPACSVVDGGFLLHRVLRQTKEPFSFILKKLVDDPREHSLHAYIQVQLWSGFAKSPIDQGWKETKHGLFPVTTYKESAPPALLSIILCKCAKGCNLTCTCRKSGIKYSSICYLCKGQGCINSPEYNNTFTNSSHQEDEIDIWMEEIISEVDLEEECETLQVEESNSKQTDINDYDSPSTSKNLKLI